MFRKLWVKCLAGALAGVLAISGLVISINTPRINGNEHFIGIKVNEAKATIRQLTPARYKGDMTVTPQSWGYEYTLENGDIVQVGDNTTSDFKATVKTIRWNDVAWFSLGWLGGTFLPTLDNEMVSFDFNSTTHVDIYTVPPSDRLPEGGIEYDITLSKKPAKPTVTLDIDWQGITWQKILPLDVEYTEALCIEKWGSDYTDFVLTATSITGVNIETSQVVTLKTRPEYEVNSYLGIATQSYVAKTDYGIITDSESEFFGEHLIHGTPSRTYLYIHRGEMTDALGNKAWVEDISLDEVAKTITFTLPSTWLRDATYPVSQVCGVDPAYTENMASFLSTDLSGDSTWTTIDLTAYGAPDSSVAEIIFGMQEAGVENVMGVRAVGSSLARYVEIHEAEGGGETHCRMFVQLDSSAQAQFYHSDISDADSFYIIGFWENTTFSEEWVYKAFLSGGAGWYDLDTGGGTFSANASTVYHMISQTVWEEAPISGIRTGGSALDRKLILHEAENGGGSYIDFMVKSDASSDIEGYWDGVSTAIYYYSGGYFGSEMDFVELWESNQGIDAWADWDLTGYDASIDGEVADFILVHNAIAATATMGVRGGDDDATARTLVEHEAEDNGSSTGELSGFSMSSQTNASGVVHIQLPATTCYAYLTGYFKPAGGGGTVDISVAPTSYDFGVVSASSSSNTTTDYFTITNSSNVTTDQTIGVTTSSWSGGVGWTHSDTATAGANTAGLKANRGGSWGSGDVIVKYSSPNYIYENCPASTSYDFGLGLVAPTSFSDGVEKEIVVRVTASEG